MVTRNKIQPGTARHSAFGVAYSPLSKPGSDDVSLPESKGAVMRSESPFTLPPRDSDDATIVSVLLREHANICSTLTEWRDQQRNTHATQERLMDRMLRNHTETMEELRRLRLGGSEASLPMGLKSDDLTAPTEHPWSTPEDLGGTIGRRYGARGATVQNLVRAEAPGEGACSPLLPAGRAECATGCGQGPEATGAAGRIAAQLEALDRDEQLLGHWRRSSGLHTVDDWVLNYREHPAGWAALLMIHGVSEFTGRLRSKVENYAIYSALFLSMSVALLAAPPDHIVEDCSSDSPLECHIRKRAYTYGLALGTAAHMLCISLGMAFVNALNETARDSDVYRMFSRGQGFRATQKCQIAFAVGCVADYVAVAVTTTAVVSGVETLVCVTLLVLVAVVIFHRTASQLFGSCSIVSYWREECGGHPDANDPYDLQIPAQCFQERARINRALFTEGSALQGGAGRDGRQSALWNDLRDGTHEKGPSNEHPQPHSQPSKKAVAMGLF